MIAGYLRGWVEVVVMRVVDVFLSIPAILLAIITVAVLGPGLVNVIMVLALTRWPRYARIAYGQTLARREHALCAARGLHGRGRRRASSSATSCPTSSARSAWWRPSNSV